MTDKENNDLNSGVVYENILDNAKDNIILSLYDRIRQLKAQIRDMEDQNTVTKLWLEKRNKQKAASVDSK